MDDKGVLLIEIISTLFVAKLVEEQMLNRTEIEDSFEILVDYQNELYGANYEIILDEKDCPLNLHSYLDSITITARLINKLIPLTQKEEDRKRTLIHFKGRYIVTNGTLKQFKLTFDTFIDFIEKQLKTA